MMRSTALAVAALGLIGFAACTPIPAGGEEEFPPPLEACGADALQDLVGTPVDELDEARLPEGARVIHPDTMVTQDYRPDRLNVEVGEDGLITRVYCG